ncbi:MAG: hypothetical protein ACI81R_003577, partial [Bradymonadia bacterium]
MIFMSSWKSKQRMSCSTCPRKANAIAILGNATFVWWGFPWGILGTPVQITRNLLGLVRPEPSQPSERLRQMVMSTSASTRRETRTIGSRVATEPLTPRQPYPGRQAPKRPPPKRAQVVPGTPVQSRLLAQRTVQMFCPSSAPENAQQNSASEVQSSSESQRSP